VHAPAVRVADLNHAAIGIEDLAHRADGGMNGRDRAAKYALKSTKNAKGESIWSARGAGRVLHRSSF
jgi:hypothetical protein